MSLRHAGPPIIQRPLNSARSRPPAASAEAEKIEDPPEPRNGHGSARHEAPFDLLEPEAVVARPLVDLDPRQLLLHRIAFNMAPSIARTPPTRSREATLLKYVACSVDIV